MPLPTKGPTTGEPVSVDHRDLVAWSYISLLDRYKKPLVPSSCCTPSTVTSYSTSAPHSVQYTPASSRPPMRSLTISCQARIASAVASWPARSEEHTSELQSPYDLVCRLLLEKKKKSKNKPKYPHT